MRLRETFAFAFGYQARQAWPWLCFLALAGITMLMGPQMQGNSALEQGYFFNAPYAVANVTQVSSLLWLPIAAVVTGSIAARDFQSRMFALACATPTARGDYLAGHFLAALALNALLALAIPLALLLCLLMQWLQPVLGPFRADAYLAAYLLIALPNGLLVTALAFSFVVLRRKSSMAMPAFGLVLFFSLFGSQFLAREFGHWELAALLDPMALTTIIKGTMSWTPLQKSTQLIGFDGATLANRVLWLSVSLAVLAFTWRRFRFDQAERTPGRRFFPARRARAAEPVAPAVATAMPCKVATTFGPATRLRQLLALSLAAFRLAATSWPGIVLLGMVAMFGVASPELLEHIGVPYHPTTGLMVELMAHSEAFFVLVLPLVLMLAAGELAWRDRDAGIAALVDATPVPDWVRFGGRFGGLVLLVLLLQALRMLVAMLLQLGLGYGTFEPLLYVQVLFGLQAAEFLLLVVLAMALQALVDHRHLGQLLVVAAFLVTIAAAKLGIEDPMLVYAADPGWSYSDMRGYASDLVPWAWFKAYWAGWALLLALLAIGLLPRGAGTGLRERISAMRLRLTRPLLAAGALAVAVIAVAGGVVFYNTHVLHPFLDRDDVLARRAQYELLYGRYEGLPQPAPTDIRLRIDLRPENATATVAGSYRLLNLSQMPIRTLHVATSLSVDTPLLAPDRPARHVIADADFGHHAFELAQPLQPGESMRLRFEVAFGDDGFSRHGISPAVAANGSAITPNDGWLPEIGYQAGRAIGNPGERRAHGLPERPEFPPLDDPDAPSDPLRAQRVLVDTVISTAPGQTAVAPGVLRRQWIQDGRAHFRYVTEAPIRNDPWFYSSDYAVLRDGWNDVAIEVFHDPSHPWNAQRIVDASKATLASMSRDFGPYPLAHLRFTEYPGDGGLHAGPGDVSFREGFARYHSEADWRDIDFSFGVVAHEVAHQWWGYRLTPAMVEGAPLLTESLAWYSALMVMRETFDAAHERRMLDVLRESFLTPRSQAGKPLLHATDWAESYRKGPFAMYALDAYVGTERVNTALRRLLDAHDGATVPLATSRDLYRELEAVTPPHLQWLLHDLLAANTYWALRTTQAGARELPDGRWEVALDVLARKVTVDEDGLPTEVAMDDLVEIGVYAAADEGVEPEALYRRMHRIRAGQQRITVVVDAPPAEAGVDPRHLLLDVKPEDNRLPVTSTLR